QADKLVEEFDTLVTQALDPNPELETVLGSALVDPHDKEKLLDRVFGSKLSPQLIDFLKVVSRHGRLDILRSIHDELKKLHDELRGRVPIEVRTAAPMNGLAGTVGAALGKLFPGELRLETVVDPSLIGG